MQNLYSFTVKDASGNSVPLEKYKGKVVMIVNVASKCGFTPQYASLEKVYKTYIDRGLVILGFPCNQFGNQEPGTDTEVQQFCSMTYGVSFPVLAKIEVNGGGADPLYNWLKSEAKGVLGTEAIKWNFTKFLIGKDGQVVDRYAPQTDPSAIAKDIEKLL